MKRIFLFAALLISVVVDAQNFQVGLKGGVNISNFTGGSFDTIQHNTLVGFHAGAFLRFKFDKFAIQPEALVSTQGSKLKYLGNEGDYKITYVNVPIMAQYESDGGFYVEAGPQFGFKVSENIPNTTLENFAKSTDIAIGAGLGYHSKIGLGIGARYNVGISKVGDFESSNINPDFKNSVIQFSLFYTIFNNKK